jgi:hypothetical protein
LVIKYQSSAGLECTTPAVFSLPGELPRLQLEIYKWQILKRDINRAHSEKSTLGKAFRADLARTFYSGGGKENYLFGGVGLSLPTVTEVSVSGFVAHTEGDPFLSNSIGIDFDGGVSVLGGSAAGYLNTSSLTSCLSGH